MPLARMGMGPRSNERDENGNSASGIPDYHNPGERSIDAFERFAKAYPDGGKAFSWHISETGCCK